MLALLQLLRRQRGQWLTMEALQRVLSLSPPEIHQKISQLQQLGHPVEQVPTYGFRLAGTVSRLTADLITYGLGTRRIGRKVLVYESTDSTNDIAWHYAREEGFDGLAVFAEHQRCGRGRFRRQWEAPAGSSILCSLLLQKQSVKMGRILTLLAGLGVAETIEIVTGISARIKWPNDIIYDGIKLAGVMVEARRFHGETSYVIGIGINCLQRREDFPPALRDKAVSLRQVCRQDVDRLQLVQHLLQQFDRWINELVKGDADTIQHLQEKWLVRCDHLARRITVMCDGKSFTGRVIDIGADQGLVLQLDSGPIKLFDAATTTVVQD